MTSGPIAPDLPDLPDLMRRAGDASAFLKAVAHQHRLLLLCLIAERERSVSELEALLSLRQASVSQQLPRLRRDGLVTARRDGKSVIYSLANTDTRRIITTLHDVFCATPSAP